MKLILQGLVKPIILGGDCVTEYVIESRTLFSRVVQSLLSEEGQYAVEPYQFVDEENGQIKPKGACILVQTPFSLPWDDKCLFGEFYDRLIMELFDDEQLRIAIEESALELQRNVARAGFAFSADYGFTSAWDLRKYLKAFGYRIDFDPSAPLLDSLIMFLAMAADVHCKKPLVFLNLESFLSESDLVTFCEQAVFYGLTVLLLASSPSEVSCQSLRKQSIDLQFCEW